jgi:hypothetical protein
MSQTCIAVPRFITPSITSVALSVVTIIGHIFDITILVSTTPKSNDAYPVFASRYRLVLR